MSVQIGDVLDEKYAIVDLIGQGGMGAVYEARHLLIHRRVAIKVLLPGIAGESAARRFEREARAAGRIGNEHILEVFDFGWLTDGGRYMVAEFLEGETLATRLQRAGRLHPDEITPIILELLDGLKAAHGAGVVHRDLKPDNVFLCHQKAGRTDFVKIIDFGVSKFTDTGSHASMRLTAQGALLGTPSYLAPEQLRGNAEPDARADLYAVGVILYQAVTGRIPFVGSDIVEILRKVAYDVPPAPAALVPNLDAEFSAIVEKAMAKDPTERFQSAEELAEALRRWSTIRAPTISLTPGELRDVGPSVSAVSATEDTSISLPIAKPRWRWLLGGGLVAASALAALAFAARGGGGDASSSPPGAGENELDSRVAAPPPEGASSPDVRPSITALGPPEAAPPGPASASDAPDTPSVAERVPSRKPQSSPRPRSVPPDASANVAPVKDPPPPSDAPTRRPPPTVPERPPPRRDFGY